MRILGLDLGIGSVGWALIETDDNYIPIRILGMGSRILNLTPDEISGFERGKGESICAQRTLKRTARKGYNRYQQRRSLLRTLLDAAGMLPSEDQMLHMPPLRLWGLRADAANDDSHISLTELGRVLLHINQKRGYRHSRAEVASGDKKQTDYVEAVERRHKEIREAGKTVGQFFYDKLLESKYVLPNGTETVNFRIKNEVLPRRAYQEEFDRIMEVQRKRFPDVLTENLIELLRNAIFYQRPLKSCKHLVSLCEFESHKYSTADGREVNGGPKVAPRTSPLSQIVRIWEVINNIVLKNSANKSRKDNPLVGNLFKEASEPKAARLLEYEYRPDAEERQRIFDYLQTNDKMSFTALLKLLGLKKSDGFTLDKGSESIFKGNSTLISLRKALSEIPNAEELTQFNLSTEIETKVDKSTGEVSSTHEVISPDYIHQPLYRLWHLLYSIADKDELAKALEKQFGITDVATVDALYAIDFRAPGYSNRSARFMRRILPGLMAGKMYSEACEEIGVNHSSSLTKEENENRELIGHLKLLPKGSLRQPVVEKILNQMINVVNALIDEYGEIDEARVELARQLRQSASQRAEASSAISKREKDNKVIADKIAEYGLKVSRNRIQKYRMWEETGHVCMYCGQPVGVKEFLESNGAEVEHIIPRSLYFDDSFANKTCACRRCNREKKNSTGYDFMKSKSEKEFESYLSRVDAFFKDKRIGKKKRDYLLMKKEEIPLDFLNRDLGLTQYISRNAREILTEAIRTVNASSGTVTDFFRHSWGYDNILHELNVERYSQGEMTEMAEFEHKGQIHSELRIKDWTKRLDHRHHAIDALTIALTRQAYIQRLNNLSANKDDLLGMEILETGHDLKRERRLVQWAETRPHFSVEDVRKHIAEIAVSQKSGKKLTVPGKRRIRRGGKNVIVQSGLAIPRGMLHKETIYGRILMPDGEKKVKDVFEDPTLIVNPKVRSLVEERLAAHGGDTVTAVKSLKKNPLKLTTRHGIVEVKSVKCNKRVFVVKTPIEGLRPVDIPSIIDSHVRTLVAERYAEVGNDQKKFQSSLTERPLYFNDSQSPIKSVRCTTGLAEASMVAPRRDSDGKVTGYALSGNNDHVAIYEDENGKIKTQVVNFWTAVKRKNAGLPIIITDPQLGWDRLMEIPDEEIREELSKSLPQPNWKFLQSLRMNETYILGLSDEEFSDAMASGDKALLLSHLYKVTGVSDNDYNFRLHTDTTSIKDKSYLSAGLYRRIQSFKTLENQNLKKIRISVIGELTYD